MTAGPPTRAVLVLPDWASTLLARPIVLATDEERMDLVLDLARRNVENHTGGPFAAGIFNRDTGALVAASVNLVEPAKAAIAHAEIVAIALAGQAVRSFDLSAAGPTELFASTEPCAMCLGSVPWSGVERLVCAARDEDARAVGFDEGEKPADWAARLTSKGIAITTDMQRAEGIAVLRSYADSGGLIYNSKVVREGMGGA